MYLDIKYLLGLFLYIIHYFLFICIIYLIIFSNDFYIIFFILIIYFLVIYSWYIFNDCLFIGFENYLLNKKNIYYLDTTDYIEINIGFRKYKIFKYVLKSYHSYIVPIIFIMSAFKLLYLFMKK